MSFGRRRFLLRVYLHGLALLVLTGVGIVLVDRLIITPDALNDFRSLTRWMVGQVAAKRADPPVLRRELDTLQTDLHLSVSLYDSSGQLIASNIDPPFPPLPAADLAALQADDLSLLQPGSVRVVGFFEDGHLAGYAMTRHTGSSLRRYRGLFFIGVLMLVIALGSIPLARSVVSPIEKVSGVARAFGAGDLSVRTKIVRRDEIGELAQAFDEMADRVTLALRSEKELLANVSHELRTPLARIRVVLDLASEVDAERSRAYLAEIAEDLAELERLVDDVLTAARLDIAEGKSREAAPPIHLEATDLRALIDKVAGRFVQRHPDRKLVVEGRDDLPVADVDGPMVRRVLENLIDNARKYSDRDVPIRVVARTAPGEVAFDVIDRGIGIDPDDIENVFRPFFRTDASRARSTGGVGLGLTLARRIVEAHGGRIELTSKPAGGTTVTFVLPVSEHPSQHDLA